MANTSVKNTKVSAKVSNSQNVAVGSVQTVNSNPEPAKSPSDEIPSIVAEQFSKASSGSKAVILVTVTLVLLILLVVKYG